MYASVGTGVEIRDAVNRHIFLIVAVAGDEDVADAAWMRRRDPGRFRKVRMRCFEPATKLACKKIVRRYGDTWLPLQAKSRISMARPYIKNAAKGRVGYVIV